MKPAFFRRRKSMTAGEVPKWHRFAYDEQKWTLVALCGYRFRFTHERPVTKDNIKQARLRCATCDEKAGVAE